jgi:hypothetical protein
MVSRLTYQAVTMNKTSTPIATFYDRPYTTVIQDGQTAGGAYSLPIYCVNNLTPKQPVWVRGTSKRASFQPVCNAVPVPDPSQIPGGVIQATGTDGSCIIINTDTGEWWEFWRFGVTDSTDPAGYNYRCQQGGYGASSLSHPGWWSGSSAFGGGSGGRPLGNDWGVSAAGGAYLGWVLTAEDWLGSAINHPIGFLLPLTGGVPHRVLPATRYDQQNFTTNHDATTLDLYRVPEGARFRLPTSFDIPTYVTANARAAADNHGSTADVLTKVLTAVRDYGLILIDSAGVVAIPAENFKTIGTIYNPYTVVPQLGQLRAATAVVIACSTRGSHH